MSWIKVLSPVRLPQGAKHAVVRSCTLALLSGMAAALAPEPVKAWPVMWVALVPLWVMVTTPQHPNHRTMLHHAAYGACWGGGYYSVVLIWMTGLHPLTWMGVPWLASVAIALFSWSVATLWGMVWTSLWAIGLGWLSGWLFAPPHTLQASRPMIQAIVRVLIGTALWCGLDWLWSQGFLYWPSLAFSQSPDNLWILQLGKWSGPITVTAAILMVNGFLAEAIRFSQRGWSGFSPRVSSSSPLSSKRLSPGHMSSAKWCGAIALSIFVGLHLIGGWMYYRPLTPTHQAPLKVGMIQGNVPTRIKLYEEGLRRAFRGYTKGYERLVEQGVDAVLTPEGAFPIFWAPPVNTRTPLYHAVLEHDVPVWLGTFVPVGDDFTQSLITLDAEGHLVSQYNKVKLVPLGEYIPFSTVLGKLVDRLSPLKSYMIPGEMSQEFKTPVGQGIVGICYESAFAELFRQQAMHGGEFILTVSNNDPYNTVMMAQHHAQDVMRAIETDRWAVRATNTGYSGVVDPHGRTLWRSQANTYQTHIANIHRRHTQTPYVKYGDWLTPLLVVGAIASIILSRIA